MRAAPSSILFHAISALVLMLPASCWSAGRAEINLAPARHPAPSGTHARTTAHRRRRRHGKARKLLGTRRSKLNNMVRRISPVQTEAGPELGQEAQLEPMNPFVGKPLPVMNAMQDPSAGPFVGAQVRLSFGQ